MEQSKGRAELMEARATAVAYHQATSIGKSKSICLTVTTVLAFEDAERIPQCLFSLGVPLLRDVTSKSDVCSPKSTYLKNQVIWRLTKQFSHDKVRAEE